MLRYLLIAALCALLLTMIACEQEPEADSDPADDQVVDPDAAPPVAEPHEIPTMPGDENLLGPEPLGIHRFTMERIDGTPQPLADYQGKVLLVVNTASKCGNTPQYAKLQDLYEKYQERGLVVLGFPANNFGNQEPGSDSDIAAFCEANYGVTFPMFSKISVKGDDQHALYAWLTEQTGGDPIGWNFEKFLIGPDGQIIDRYAPRTQPDSDDVVTDIEQHLPA